MNVALKFKYISIYLQMKKFIFIKEVSKKEKFHQYNLQPCCSC